MVNLVSGVVATIVLVLALTLTSGNAAKYFSATLGVVISMVTIVYVLIFPAVIKLRYSHPDVPRPYRIPGGNVGLWTAGILTTAWAAFTTIAIIYPGIGTAHPDAVAAERVRGPAASVHAVSGDTARGDDSHRPAVLRSRRAYPAASCAG